MAVTIETGNRVGLIRRRDELVNEHLAMVPPLARSIAARLPPSFDIEDLVSEGYVGLLRAATRYRPELHGQTPFSAYARLVIVGAMIDSIRRGAWVENTRASITAIGEGPGAAIDPGAAVDAGRLRERVMQAIERMPARLRTVIHWHYACEMGLPAVGEMLAVSASRASQIHMEAIRELRAALAA